LSAEPKPRDFLREARRHHRGLAPGFRARPAARCSRNRIRTAEPHAQERVLLQPGVSHTITHVRRRPL